MGSGPFHGMAEAKGSASKMEETKNLPIVKFDFRDSRFAGEETRGQTREQSF